MPGKPSRPDGWRRRWALVLLCCATGFATAQDAPTTGTLAIGPFRLGMSLDEIKAAAPQTAWRDTRLAAFSRRVTAMRSVDAVTIEGVAFQVLARAPYYQHGLQLQSDVRVANATACEQAALTWLSRVETQLGPFQSLVPRQVAPGPNSLQWNTQRSANGSVSVTPSMNFEINFLMSKSVAVPEHSNASRYIFLEEAGLSGSCRRECIRRQGRQPGLLRRVRGTCI